MGMFSREKEKVTDEVLPESDGFSPNEGDFEEGVVNDNADGLQRHLANRQIQLIAIGGSIGTALFVTIGKGLYYGGPASLFIAYTSYACVVALVNNCIAEMSIAFPVSGGFIRLAGHWCDDALGFTAGWNFFLYEALLIPFEITALITVISFWSADIENAGPSAGIVVGCIVCYAAINILAVRAYGEAEFWLSGGKVILIIMLFFFTFITMVGGNPEGDAYGFRYWEGADYAFKPYLSTGSTGRFEGFLACVWSASFCIVGPEYMSMVAAEAKRPRVYIKTAFKTVYFRFGLFFIGGALAAGIVCNSHWKALADAVNGKGAGTAAASPYVIAMQHYRIKIFPDIVNALMMTSIFSAGNTYTYCAVRNLYGLALEGRAPRFLAYCTKKGVPLWSFCVVMFFPFLAFLSLSKGSEQALTWLINITTAGGIIDYIIMALTYIQFYRACKVQGLDRKTLPYTGWCQPYCAYIALSVETIVVLCYGYSTFRVPSGFSVVDFFSYYILVLLDPILFVFWKFFKRTKWLKPHEVDLVWERPTIDAYEATFIDEPIGFWREIIQLFGVWKQRGGNDKRVGSISN